MYQPIDEFYENVKNKPYLYIGYTNSKGVNNLTINSMWELYRTGCDLELDISIEIDLNEILVRIVDKGEALDEIFQDLEGDLLVSFALAKKKIINYNDNKNLFLDDLNDLKDFRKYFKKVNYVEYILDYKFLNSVKKDKLYYELIGKAKAFLAINTKSKIEMKDNINKFSTVLHYPDGICDYLRELDCDRTSIKHENVFYLQYKNNNGEFYLALRSYYTGPRRILSYANGNCTVSGGMHVRGLEDGLRGLYERSNTRFYKCTSYFAVLYVFMDKCTFLGPTRERVESREAYDLIFEGIEKGSLE